MRPDTLLLLYAFLAVLALIVLIAGFKLHPFVVLVAVSLALGAVAGMPLPSVVKAFQDGVVGIPVFFQVGFMLLIPLVFTIARRSGLSVVKIGIPLVAGLSVVHGMVPPHPAAMLAVGAYHADIGRTIAYAILVGLPTAALAGPIFASWIAPRIALPADSPIAAQLSGEPSREMPGFGLTLFTVLLPVILMLA